MAGDVVQVSMGTYYLYIGALSAGSDPLATREVEPPKLSPFSEGPLPGGRGTERCPAPLFPLRGHNEVTYSRVCV